MAWKNSFVSMLAAIVWLMVGGAALAQEPIISRDAAYAREFLALINGERQRAGLALLAADEHLNQAALARLYELMDNFGERPGGASLADLLGGRAITFDGADLGYARGLNSPAEIVASFREQGYPAVTDEMARQAGVAVGQGSDGLTYYAVITLRPKVSDIFSGPHAARKEAVFQALNHKRGLLGAPPLTYEPGLDRAAGVRAAELARSYRAERPDGSGAMDLFRRHTYALASYLQAYGRAKPSPLSFARDWLKKMPAPDVLKAQYRSLGLGMTVRDGALYWCLVAVEPNDLPTFDDLDGYRREVLRLTNRERTKRGLNELKTHPDLWGAAQARAGELHQWYSPDHLRPDGRQWVTILPEWGLKWRTSGENIAKGQATPQMVVNGWMNSPGHRENILGPAYTHLGVGARVSADGLIHWSQNFMSFR